MRNPHRQSAKRLHDDPTVPKPAQRGIPGSSNRAAARYAHVVPAPPTRSVQRKSTPGSANQAAAGQSALDIALYGVGKANERLPYAQQIQAAFGHHDISNIKVASDSAAKSASKALGARAYATGDTIAFAEMPDLHTAAHEAAHVVQQRAGVHLAQNVGRSGDAYEQHADRVADLVVAGKSAQATLDEMAGGSGALAAVQRSEVEDPATDSAAPSQSERLLALVGTQVSDGGGYTFVLRDDLAFEIVTAPSDHQSSVGKTFAANSTNANLAQAWQVLADKILKENPTSQPPQTGDNDVAPDETSLWDSFTGLVGDTLQGVADTVSGVVGSLRNLLVGAFPADEAAPEVDETPAQPEFDSELDELMGHPTLTPEQIARARELIAELPEAEQAAQYERLQEKNEYKSQRDNESTGHGATQDNMCNLTSLAMCLEYCGISNPGTLNGTNYPQFEDYLEALRIDIGLGKRTGGYVLRDLALEMGISDFVEVTGTGNYTEAQWRQWHSQFVCAGYSMLLSVGEHIVRWQGLNDAGLVIDDPYGVITLQPSTDVNHRWSYDTENKNEKGAADNKGEDNVWLWADVEAHAMKWMFAFGM